MILRDETLRAGGQSVHLLRGGSGAPLLVLHGWGSTGERYRNAFTHIPDAAVSVVIPDLPGFGATSAPPAAWGVEEYAFWVRELLSALRWSSCVVLGHSFGGRIAIMLAATAPQKLRGLILYGAAGVTPPNRMKLTVFRTLAKMGGALFRLPWLRKIAPFAQKVLYRLAGTRDYPHAGNLQPVFRKVVVQDLLPLLRAIAVPTGILWGRNDRETPVADAETLQREISHSHLRILDGVGHAIHRENPRLFAEELLSLLRRFPAP
jgi:pimeloyl-ACP methyl ester carboxylesterase